MSDAWDVFVLTLDPRSLESERCGMAAVVEAFTGHRHQSLLMEHERRRVLFRGRHPFPNQENRVDLSSAVHAPARAAAVVARVEQSVVRELKPDVVPRSHHRKQEVFTDRQLAIALAVLDAQKLKPSKHAE